MGRKAGRKQGWGQVEWEAEGKAVAGGTGSLLPTLYYPWGLLLPHFSPYLNLPSATFPTDAGTEGALDLLLPYTAGSPQLANSFFRA